MSRQPYLVTTIAKRKDDHLDLCATDDVAFRDRTTLLECVRLVHQSLPEMALSELDTRVTLCGKTLRAPILIAGMTGGTERAGEINRALAAVAERRGYAFGLGSQRAMSRSPDAVSTYTVREQAPTTLLFGNIGIVQASQWPTAQVAELVAAVGADAVCVHMNPAMEIVQPEGDRDFRGGLDTFRRLVSELAVPVIAKETGNGVSRELVATLFEAGVRHVDVSGAGGTSWVGVETLRATGAGRALGEALWDWGIPTAASVVYSHSAKMTTIATGGIRTGLDVARSVALGARVAGIARPVFQAYTTGGVAAVDTFFDAVESELRAVMLLTGSRSCEHLRLAPRIISGELRDWVGPS